MRPYILRGDERCACGLRLSHWRLLGFWVGGRCVARTREAHLDIWVLGHEEENLHERLAVKY
jgi:hypothetical protein